MYQHGNLLSYVYIGLGFAALDLEYLKYQSTKQTFKTCMRDGAKRCSFVKLKLAIGLLESATAFVMVLRSLDFLEYLRDCYDTAV
jgi:hypothetical protein